MWVARLGMLLGVRDLCCLWAWLLRWMVALGRCCIFCSCSCLSRLWYDVFLGFFGFVRVLGFCFGMVVVRCLGRIGSFVFL